MKVKVPKSESPQRLLSMAQENARLLAEEQDKLAEKSAPDILQRALNMREAPHHIEGMDVSNLQGGNPTISLCILPTSGPLKVGTGFFIRGR